MIESYSVIKQIEDQIISEIDGESVLMSISNGSYFNLNKTGTIIWNKLKIPITYEQLIEEITADFEVTRARCEPDIKELLAELLNHQLITIS